MVWDKVSFVLASKKRKEIVKLLKTPRTPTQLAKLLSMSQSNVSLKLLDMEKKGIVNCLNPKSKKGRIYQLTADGKKVLKKLNEMESK